eukprot:COSAG02_NODE_1427_length_12664_cov_3.151850_6_plen_32_part_00
MYSTGTILIGYLVGSYYSSRDLQLHQREYQS